MGFSFYTLDSSHGPSWRRGFTVFLMFGWASSLQGSQLLLLSDHVTLFSGWETVATRNRGATALYDCAMAQIFCLVRAAVRTTMNTTKPVLLFSCSRDVFIMLSSGQNQLGLILLYHAPSRGNQEVSC